jgi:hypothetical protein
MDCGAPLESASKNKVSERKSELAFEVGSFVFEDYEQGCCCFRLDTMSFGLLL